MTKFKSLKHSHPPRNPLSLTKSSFTMAEAQAFYSLMSFISRAFIIDNSKNFPCAFSLMQLLSPWLPLFPFPDHHLFLPPFICHHRHLLSVIILHRTQMVCFSCCGKHSSFTSSQTGKKNCFSPSDYLASGNRFQLSINSLSFSLSFSPSLSVCFLQLLRSFL